MLAEPMTVATEELLFVVLVSLTPAGMASTAVLVTPEAVVLIVATA